jgi:hypothetical protein
MVSRNDSMGELERNYLRFDQRSLRGTMGEKREVSGNTIGRLIGRVHDPDRGGLGLLA